MFSSFSNLPRPVQGVAVLGTGAGITSIVMAVIKPESKFWLYLAIGIVVLVVVLALYRLVLFLRDKAKSGPFANLLTKAGTRAAADPAQKARMDDLRKRFEEGVTTFKAAGKDLYSLPWFPLVGPAGSGKTEAMRHCNVGFPPGLQDCLQGSGGTLNMHWWFTNHAVVLDTAGRMFMDEAAEGGSNEWKEFLKLLKAVRPNVPINGLLLVISAESLLKDSAEKIESTAGAIARQLDVIQRTLDVRFPVFVFITKCDKIVGFRDFFETLNDPTLQHQMLGWSNPAPLDEAFRPDQVDAHLETVRQKLIRRRFGLMQNPVHTTDPNLRRTDQVDEMFELPDNLVRIAPRLRRYLEMIFVAGEWSPKPLFLRGIYFTSSMREGQALDVSLASALGVDVESIPGSREWDKDRAYFLRDTFLSKVFKERGLVTRATNVSKALRKQRIAVIGGTAAAAIILAGLSVLGFYSFKSSLGPPSEFWSGVRKTLAGDEKNSIQPVDLRLVDGAGDKYFGAEEVKDAGDYGLSNVRRRADVLTQSAEWATRTKDGVKLPAIAVPLKPFLGFEDGIGGDAGAAHRALVNQTVVVPLVQATRGKIQNEKVWNDEAIDALAQLVRLQTYAKGGKPAAEGGGMLAAAAGAVKDAKGAVKGKVPPKKKNAEEGPVPAIDVDALFRYVLPGAARQQYEGDSSRIVDSVAVAYPEGLSKDVISPTLEAGEVSSVNIVDDGVDHLIAHLKNLGATPGSEMAKVKDLIEGLAKFRDAELALQDIRWLKTPAGAPAGMAGDAPKNLATYKEFVDAVGEQQTRLTLAKQQVDQAIEQLGASADDPGSMLSHAGQELAGQIESYFARLLDQLPPLPVGMTGDPKKDAEIAKGAALLGDSDLNELRGKLLAERPNVDKAVKDRLDKLAADLKNVAALAYLGKADREEKRAYDARFACYDAAFQELAAAEQAPTPRADGLGAAGSLSDEIASADAATSGAKAKVDPWAAWSSRTAPADAQSVLADGREASIRVSKRMIDIVASKRMYDVAMRTVKAWPASGPDLKKQAADVAKARLSDGTYKRKNRPELPLTEMDQGDAYAPEFLAQTAAEIMGGWSQIRMMVEGGTSQRAILAADAIKKDRDYLTAAETSADYAKAYLAYWKAQANEAARPTVQSWAEFSRKVTPSSFSVSGIKEKLLQLRDDVRDALTKIPANVLNRPEQLETDKKDVERSFAELESEAFEKDVKSTLGAWKDLDSSPAKARDEILRQYAAGRVKDEYFQAFRADAGKGAKYWNDFQLLGLRILVKETSGEIGDAGATLIRSRGIPLATGDLGDLTPDQLRAAKFAAAKLAAAAPSSGSQDGAARNRNLEEELAKPLQELSGSNLVNRDRETQAWFAKVQSMLASIGDGKPFRATMRVAINNLNTPKAASPGTDAGSAYQYATFFVGGQRRGTAFQTSAPTTDAKAKELVFDYPDDFGKPVEIWLYEQDPKAQAILDAPKAKIVLPSGWGIMGEVFRHPDDSLPGRDGVCRVLLSGGGYYLWMDAKFEPELPAKEVWPAGASWPQ